MGGSCAWKDWRCNSEHGCHSTTPIPDRDTGKRIGIELVDGLLQRFARRKMRVDDHILRNGLGTDS